MRRIPNYLNNNNISTPGLTSSSNVKEIIGDCIVNNGTYDDGEINIYLNDFNAVSHYAFVDISTYKTLVLKFPLHTFDFTQFLFSKQTHLSLEDGYVNVTPRFVRTSTNDDVYIELFNESGSRITFPLEQQVIFSWQQFPRINNQYIEIE